MRQKALSTVYKLAKSNPRVLFIGSDLGAGTLSSMREDIPDQFFMEGVSEQHIVGFAAGLAQEGFIPYVNTIGTFLTRRYFEQVSIDVGLHRLPVRLLASGGGMVYAPLGPTHTAVEDFSLMLSIPNMKVFAPADAFEMENLLTHLVNDEDPHYVRFGKGGEKIVTENYPTFDLKPKFFLKIDIEGSEYEILQDIISFSNYINALVIEFHDVHLNLNKITNFIENIDLKLIHVHPNNNSNCVNNIPIVLEFSFERNPIIVEDNVSFPHYLDQKNNKRKDDLSLDFSDAK